MTDNKNEEKKEYDIYRDSLLRYLGKQLALTPQLFAQSIFMMQY